MNHESSTEVPAPSAPKPPATRSPLPGRADAPLAHVHRQTVGEAGILANGYLVEGATGVVALDSALTVSGGRALRQALEELEKPLLAVLLTHGHPDHYNERAFLVELGADPVAAELAAEADARRSPAA